MRVNPKKPPKKIKRSAPRGAHTGRNGAGTAVLVGISSPAVCPSEHDSRRRKEDEKNENKTTLNRSLEATKKQKNNRKKELAMSPKEAYVISINKLAEECDDLSLLDLVYKILAKSMPRPEVEATSENKE